MLKQNIKKKKKIQSIMIVIMIILIIIHRTSLISFFHNNKTLAMKQDRGGKTLDDIIINIYDHMVFLHAGGEKGEGENK